jgi:class 3 adenylate cyclase
MKAEMSARERRRYGTYPAALMIPRTADEPNGCPDGHLTGRQMSLGQGGKGRLSAMAEPDFPEGQGRANPGSRPTERVADADRERTVTLLGEHVAEGRLTLDEFSERMGVALQAKTRGELDDVMADLPARAEQRDSAPTTPTAEGAPPRKTSRWHLAIMSGHSTKGRWRIGGKTKAVAVMGGCDIDLRRAEIEGPEVEITAVAFWGGIEIIVPEGFDVDLRGFSFMGGRSLRLRDVPIVPGSPRIVVRGFAIMGGIEVKSRPLRSARRLPSSSRARTSRLPGSTPQHIGTAVSSAVVDALDAAAAAVPDGPVDLRALGRQIRRELEAQLPTRQRVDDTRVVPEPPHNSGPVTGAPPPPPPSPPTSPSAPASSWTPTDAPAGAPERTPAESGDGGVPLPNDGTVTILFCDMADYAGMTERLGDQASWRILVEHHRIVREALARRGGREIKVQGDGFMVAFGGVARAMRCAIDIQRAFRDHLVEGERVAVHIGIHTGDAVAEDEDYLGHTVIVASRLADAAAAGEILVSSLSEQLVQRSGEFVFDGHRETLLKGMARPQPASTLSWDD